MIILMYANEIWGCYTGNLPTMDIPRYQSVILISISIVNNPPRMYKFLSPTFACIWSRIFLSPSLYSTNRRLHFHIKKGPVPNHYNGQSRPHAWPLSHIKVMDRQIVPQSFSDAHCVARLIFRNNTSILLSLLLLHTCVCVYIYKKNILENLLFKSIGVNIFLFENSQVKIYTHTYIYIY